MKVFRLLFFLMVVFVIPKVEASCNSDGQNLSSGVLSVDTLIDDMDLKNERFPLGVPSSYDWHSKGVIHLGSVAPPDFRSITGWGQIFKADHDFEDGAGVLIGKLILAVYSRSKDRWVVLQNSENLVGGAFRPDYKYNVASKADIAYLANGTRAVLGQNLNIHFFPREARPIIDADDVGDVVVAIFAKRGESGKFGGEILLGAGADFWQRSDSIWDNWKTNKGIGTGRLKVVSKNWSWFTFSTAKDRRRLSSLAMALVEDGALGRSYVCLD